MSNKQDTRDEDEMRENIQLDLLRNKSRFLLEAARRDQKEMVQLLIEAGGNVNAEDNDKMTPLMMASFRGHLDVARLLIEAGARRH